MKVLAVLLLCAFAGVQGRSAGVQSGKSLAALGDVPYIVHLRTAVSTSGFLNSFAGSLIGSRWVLTSGSAVADIRFAWIRYGTVDVISPSLVTEASTARVNPNADLAIIPVNRDVETTEYIQPIPLKADFTAPFTVSFCGFGEISVGVPGESLSCYSLETSQGDGGVLTATSGDGATSRFDVGAPLVAEGIQVAVLVAPANEDSAGTFLLLSEYVDWVQSETGLDFSPEPETDSLRVKFVN